MTTRGALVVGDVVGKSIDPPGDVDQCTVDVPDGQGFASYGTAPASIWFVP